jgi:hypothetical protein
MALDQNNAPVLANSAIALGIAASIASAVVREIAGNDIASTINGTTCTGALAESLVMTRIANNLRKRKAT